MHGDLSYFSTLAMMTVTTMIILGICRFPMLTFKKETLMAWSGRISHVFEIIYILLAQGIKNGALKRLKVGHKWKPFYISRKKQAIDAMSDYGEKMEKLEKLQEKKSTTKMEVGKRQVQLAGEAVSTSIQGKFKNSFLDKTTVVKKLWSHVLYSI